MHINVTVCNEYVMIQWCSVLLFVLNDRDKYRVLHLYQGIVTIVPNISKSFHFSPLSWLNQNWIKWCLLAYLEPAQNLPKHTPISHHIITIQLIQDIINWTSKHIDLVYWIQLYLLYLNLAPRYINFIESQSIQTCI